jgi:hypothetical protein
VGRRPVAEGKAAGRTRADRGGVEWHGAHARVARLAAARELTAAELNDEWQALRGEDVARAYRALWVLRSVPGQALPLLRRHLRPGPAADEERAAKLVKDLESDDFAVREKATAELEGLGGAAKDALHKALEGDPSAELRRRGQQLLNKIRPSLHSPHRVQALRMLELLEQIATPEASRVPQQLAEDKTDPWLAQESRAAAARLRDRDGAKP